ncbi:MAG: repeat-associated core domain protein [Chthonomonadaceae bacterium]|nr:repeat-associated core domain protein [Chthonomonadaceae bacterium]
MRDYVPDPLGSAVALLDNTQTQTDTFSYWPYGEVRARTGIVPTPFRFIGTQGYYQDDAVKTYVRARYLITQHGRWQNLDPIGFDGGDANLYRYVSNKAVSDRDASGLATSSCDTVLKCLKATPPYNCKTGSECGKQPNAEVDTYLAVCVAWQESCFQDPIVSCGAKGKGGWLQITCGRIKDIDDAQCNPGGCLCKKGRQDRNPGDECAWAQAGFRWLQCTGLDSYGEYTSGERKAIRACAACMRKASGCSQWSKCKQGLHG